MMVAVKCRVHPNGRATEFEADFLIVPRIGDEIVLNVDGSEMPLTVKRVVHHADKTSGSIGGYPSVVIHADDFNR